jgi:hypothetical protein
VQLVQILVSTRRVKRGDPVASLAILADREHTNEVPRILKIAIIKEPTVQRVSYLETT